MAGGRVAVDLLGPLRVWVDGAPVVVPAGRSSAVLAVLALARGAAVSADVLAEQVWGTARRNAVAMAVSRLRKVLGAQAVVAEPGGYRLVVEPDDLDITRFRTLLDGVASECATSGDAGPGRAGGDAEQQLATLEEALALWRGEPLTGVGLEPPVVLAWLRERRLQALERSAELRLELGRHRELTTELPGLVAAYPLRERFTVLLMLALYRSGRQAEALTAFDELRTRMSEELGVDPGPDAARLHQRILRADPALAAPVPNPAPVPNSAPAPDPVPAPSPAPVPSPAPAQLPAAVRGFVGREAELGALDRMLDASGVVVITGPAGVGKTALAVSWGQGVREAFPDGQVYLDLGGYGPGQPLTAAESADLILRAFGTAGADIAEEPQARSAQLRSALADRRILLVLDNARDSGQVAPLLPGSGCVTLVTSRSLLPGLTVRHGAQRLALAALDGARAVRLLAAVVGERRVDAEPEAAAALVGLCDGLPLAVRIAAERIARYPDVPIAELVAELGGESGRLDVLDAAEDDLTVSVRGVLSWSYRALRDEAARMFRFLPLLPSAEFDVSSAAAVAGVPLVAARRALDQLATLHLLERRRGDRVGLHQLVRAYAAELSVETEAARQRLVSWYIQTVAAACAAVDPQARPAFQIDGEAVTPLAFATREQALRWCDAERRNVLTIAELAAAQRLHETVCAFAALFWTYLDMRGYPGDVLVVHRLALASARALGDRAAEGPVLTRLGVAHALLGHRQEALACVRAALLVNRERGDRVAEAESLTDLARIQVCVGDDPGEAVRTCREALAILDGAGRADGGWRTWNNLAMAYHQLGECEQALAAVDEALRIAASAGRGGSRAQLLGSIGMRAYTLDTRARVYSKLGAYDRALEDFREARRVAVELGEWRLEAEALVGEGRVLQAQGDLGAARQVWLRARDRYRAAEAYSATREVDDLLRTTVLTR